MKKRIGIICWGPIESLRNGYFIRVYVLIEKLVSLFIRSSKNENIKIYEIEYSEDLKAPYNMVRLGKLSKAPLEVIKIRVPGNEKYLKGLFKNIRFFVYQIINSIKLIYIIRKINIIFIEGESFLPSLLLIKLINRKAIIVSDPHMLLSEKEKRSGRVFASKLFYFIEKIYLKLSNIIIAISDKMKYNIINEFKIYNDKIIVIPHLLPNNLLNTPICRGKNNASVIKLAFMGSLNARQNFEAVMFLLSVVPFLKSVAKKRIELVIIGGIDDDVRKALNKVIEEKGVLDSVVFTGYVEDPDMFLCDADVLLAPMFTMSGVSTKVLYYLRFRDKIILVSKEAVEGLEHLISKRNDVVVANTPIDYARKLIKVVKELSRQ